MATPKKYTRYADKTDNYIIQTYTGKTKKSNSYGDDVTLFQFEETAKDPNNKWYGKRLIWRSEGFFTAYLSPL